MTNAGCLILTTGHHRDDGRLNRHVEVLERRGVKTTIIAHESSRLMRLIAAPFVVFRFLRAMHPSAVVFPDPELLVVGPMIARWMGIRSVLDVHEDYRAVAQSRDWIPSVLRAGVAWAVGAALRWGRRRASATIVAARHLAEPGDFVVENVPDRTVFPQPEHIDRRNAVVYVGDITEARGVFTMLEVIRLVPEVGLELIGSISSDLEQRVRDQANRDGTIERVVLTGRLPYGDAWTRAAGALAGLSLLRPTPAYREAVPSKLWEYMAAGLPIIAADLPAQRALIKESGAGAVVDGPEAAAAVIGEWMADPQRAESIGRRGRGHYEIVEADSDAGAALLEAVLGSPDEPFAP